MDLRDGVVLRWVWSLLGRLPLAPGRTLASLVTRTQSLWEAGYWKTAHRVSGPAGRRHPRLAKIPMEWAGVVAVRRLGLRFELDLRDNLQATMYYAGRYEPAVRRFLRRELRAGDVVVDVGAHIGVHALAAARWLRRRGGGRVVAFEPTSDSAAKLRTGARRNGLRVEVVQAALGEGDGRVRLYADPRYDTADAGVRSQYGDGALVEEVPVRSFDGWAELAGLRRLDVVKIDVEGAEAAVLAGMVRSLRTLRPRAVLVEVKHRGRTGVSAEELRALLSSCGYESTGTRLDHNELFRPTG